MSQMNVDTIYAKDGTSAPVFPSGVKPADTTTCDELDFYSTENFVLDGSYTGNVTATATRIGNIITISTKNAPTTGQTSAAASSAGVVPEAYRPNSDVYNVSYFGGTNLIKQYITSAGTVGHNGQLFAGGASTVGGAVFKIQFTYHKFS